MRTGRERIPGITGVILAGGSSSRMGRDKALLPVRGERLIESIYRQVSEMFDEVLLVTNQPERYRFLPCRSVRDIYPGMGALAGIHAGLFHSANPRIFAVACDMPYLNEELARVLVERLGACDVVIPESDKGMEPLYAIYGKGALPAIEESLAAGHLRIVSFFDRIRVACADRDEVSRVDPTFKTFRNINTPEEYFTFLRNV